MAQYKTSKESKNKILQASKELFYLQGYKNTTYVDICEKANSNPGLINYYFKTKKNIAATIYGEFFIQLKNSVKDYMIRRYGYYDLQYGTTLEQRIFTNLLANDECLGRFYYDICLEGVEYDLDVLFQFYKLHVDEYNLPLSDEMVKLIQTTVVGAGVGITKRIVEGFIKLDFHTVFNYRIRFMFNLLGVSNERVDEILEQTEKMFSEVKFSLKDYFEFSIDN